jgi:hypothetical protein
MEQATHNKVVSFIWGIADDVLRDLFKRGKYLRQRGQVHLRRPRGHGSRDDSRSWVKVAALGEVLDLDEKACEAIDRKEVVVLAGESRQKRVQKFLPIIRTQGCLT